MSPTAQPLDVVALCGELSSDPEVTVLASGSTLHRYQVTVRLDDGTETVPVGWFDPSRPPALAAGDHVVVVGRVSRRFFRAGGAVRSSTEVRADAVVPARRKAAASRVLRAAADRIGARAGDAADGM